MQKNGLFSLGYDMGDISHCSGSVCVCVCCKKYVIFFALIIIFSQHRGSWPMKSAYDYRFLFGAKLNLDDLFRIIFPQIFWFINLKKHI